MTNRSPVGVVSAALAAPARLSRPDCQGKNTQLRNNSDFGFHGFIWLNAPGTPQLQLTIESSALVGRERITLPVSGLLALLRYDPEIFRSYELSTRRATSR